MATTLTSVAKAKCLANLSIDLDTIRIYNAASDNLRLSDATGSGGSGSGWSGSGTGIINKAAWNSVFPLGTGFTCVGFRMSKSLSTSILTGGVTAPGLSGDGTWPNLAAGDVLYFPAGTFTLAYT